MASKDHSGTPAYVGLILRLPQIPSDYPLSASWSYFRLERWPNNPSTPTPTATATDAPIVTDTPTPTDADTPTATSTNTPISTLTCTLTPTQAFPSGSVTITYAYDVLQRPTAADYSDGRFYH